MTDLDLFLETLGNTEADALEALTVFDSFELQVALELLGDLWMLTLDYQYPWEE